jgi:hypothetical protein
VGNTAKEAIKQVIEQAYVQGIHETLDETTVRSGFHQDFAMLVLQDDIMQKVNLDEWFGRIEVMKAENPELWSAETICEFLMIDVAGNAAVAKLDVYKGETYFSTDYMLLYKFQEGWRIVSKVFTISR